MKIIPAFLLIFFSNCIFSQINSLSIDYTISKESKIIDNEDAKINMSSTYNYLISAQDVLRNLKFKLIVKNSIIGQYKPIKLVRAPIKGMSDRMSEMVYDLAYSFAEDGRFFINLKENAILNDFDSPDGTHYIISSKANKYQWKLTKETKKISGYTCYKATTQKITNNMAGTFAKPVTAWYAPAIPIPFGPKDYNGLPGLILELQEGTIGLYATKINLNPKEKIEINKPTKGKLMTQEEYDKSNGASYERAKNLLGG